MTPIGNLLGAFGFLVWLLVQAWTVITGPVNVPGWIFNASLFLLAPLIGLLAARVLDRKAAR